MLSGYRRQVCGKSESHRARRQGKVPAVLYGHERTNLNLEIGTMDLISEIKRHGEHAVVELSIDGMPHQVIIKELQRHPVSREPIHVDFQYIEDGQRLRARIPIVIRGDKSFTDSSDIVQVQLSDVEVDCPVDKLPRYLVANVSGMSLGDRITLADLEVSEEISIIGNPLSVVASIGRSSVKSAQAEQIEEPVINS